MSVEWKEYQLMDVALESPHAMSTGPFGSSISSKFFQETGVPVIRGGNLSSDISNRMSDEGLVFISKDKAEEFRRSVVRSGDLIFTCWGTINQVGLITDELKYSEYIISNKQMKVTVDPRKADHLFLYYLFSSPLKQAEILSNAIGAAVPGFNLGQLKKHTIYLPSVEEQRRISSILNSFDKKIRHNKDVNQTLEQIAQALFKSWFVDFEPIRAKIAAKETGASHEEIERAAMCAISGKTPGQLAQLPPETQQNLKTTAALFPDALVDSELGEVPEGWHVSEIGKEVDVVGGGTPSTANTEFWEDGEHHWTTPKDMSNLTDKILLETDRKITDAGLRKISSGLLPRNTVLMSSRAPVGYLAIAKIPVAINQGYIAMKCEKILSPEYVVQWAESVMDEIKQRSSGTTFAEISKTNFRLIRTLVPNEKLVQAYTKEASSVYEKITSLLLENRELISIRDSLLPKLLSGGFRDVGRNELRRMGTLNFLRRMME